MNESKKRKVRKLKILKEYVKKNKNKMKITEKRKRREQRIGKRSEGQVKGK